jgi:lysophospholipid acyltransferase (LPLAT)-like uncharacterized protein
MVAKPGVAQLAELVGATEVGVFYARPDNAWILKTWDRFPIPKPFSTVTITWPGMAEPQLAAIQAKLDLAVAMAEAPIE